MLRCVWLDRAAPYSQAELQASEEKAKLREKWRAAADEARREAAVAAEREALQSAHQTARVVG